MDLSEKYRPKTLDDLVGQDEIVDLLKDKSELTHMLLLGPPGCGKTTLAHIMALKFNLPIHETNASDDRGIGYVRSEIKRLSRIKGKRIILLDEADNLTTDAQAALRRTIEKTDNAIFILTGNDGWKIIEPLKSRCEDYNFKRLDDISVLKKILEICKNEEIEIDEEAQEGLIELMKQVNGDMRKAIKTLSKILDKSKKITKKVVLSFQKPHLSEEALQVALGGDLEKAQKLIEDAFLNARTEAREIIKEFYEAVGKITDARIKALLFVNLAKVERACKTESDPILPLVQLISFLSYAWLVPHLQGCPLTEEEKK